MTDQTEDDLVLSELNDVELVEQMHDDLYDGLREEIVEGTRNTARSWLERRKNSQ